MDYRSWHVGMKVVCVGERPGNADVDAVYPEIGQIYTIRELRDDTARGKAGVFVLLAEIDNRHFIGRASPRGFAYVEPGFNPNGFRPLVTRKTDISIFTAMLTGAKERSKEPAHG